MAETLTLFTSPSTCIPLSREQSTFFRFRRFPRPKSRSFRFAVKSSADDGFGLFPWENPHLSESSIQWVSEDKVTLFTSDGMVQIGGNLVPRRVSSNDGLDTSRRLCIFGFCRSVEMLCDVVEDAVLEHGGEVVAAEKASKGGLHEKLKMTVAVPLLWGVPPASETLHFAVRSGGGIVDKIYWQWDFL